MSEITAEEAYEKAAGSLLEEFGNLCNYLYRDKSLFPPRMNELVGGWSNRHMDWVSPETEQSWLRWLRYSRRVDDLTGHLVTDQAEPWRSDPSVDVAIPGLKEGVIRAAVSVYEGCEAGLREFNRFYGSLLSNEGLFWFYADTQLAAALTAEAAGVRIEEMG